MSLFLFFVLYMEERNNHAWTRAVYSLKQNPVGDCKFLWLFIIYSDVPVIRQRISRPDNDQSLVTTDPITTPKCLVVMTTKQG